MKREVAKEVIELMLEFGERLDKSVALVQQNAPENETTEYRRAVGSLMGDMLLNIMNPIFSEHPELKPDQLD